MGGSAADLIHLEVPCDRDAPHVVRDAIDRLDELRQVREDARLLASELVTNAVLHSGCRAEDLIEVRAAITPHGLLISVDDPGGGGQNPRLRPADDSGLGGFGLRLVSRLARRWGWDRPNGHRVWAELAMRT